jgi:hypothetical protein
VEYQDEKDHRDRRHHYCRHRWRMPGGNNSMLKTHNYREDIGKLLEENGWGVGTILKSSDGTTIKISDLRVSGNLDRPQTIVHAQWPIGGSITVCSLTCREWLPV